MPPRREPSWALLVGSLVALCSVAPTPAHASCGLDQCPIDAAPTSSDAPAVALRSHTRVSAAAGATGAWYGETYVGALVLAPGSVRLGGSLPLVALSTPEGTVAGVGNAVVVVDWAVPVRSSTWRAAVGSQVELPTATDGDLGEAHLMVLPYGRVEALGSAFGFTVTAGWARTVAPGHGHSHGHDGTPLVNPHSDSELRLRGQAGWTRARGQDWLRLGPQIDVVQELVETRSTLVSAGPFLDIGTGRTTIRIRGELPLTEARRTDARVGLSLNVALGALHGEHHPSDSPGAP